MKWVKNHIKQIIIYIIIYAGLMLFFTYPLPYELYLPGGVNSAQLFVEFDNSYPSSGTFNSSYVSVVTKPSPFQYLLAKANKKADINKMGKLQSSLPISEILESDRLGKKSSIYASIITAYNQAKKEINYTEAGVVIIYRYLDMLAYEKIQVGDIIIEVNNLDVDNYYDLASVIKPISCSEDIKVTVLRDNKELILNVRKTETDNGCLFGISTYNTFTNYENMVSNPEFEIVDDSGYGSSAGLIQTLSIYNALTELDISFGLKIAGTGTISTDGTVGPIGGIKQKVFGACKANVDLFFTPKEHYEDAIKARDIMKSDMVIVSVESFKDALTYLLSNYGAAD